MLLTFSSLDLHHEIEVLKASLNESRQTVANLKNELKLHSEGNEAVEQRYQDQLDSHQEKYDRLVTIFKQTRKERLSQWKSFDGDL